MAPPRSTEAHRALERLEEYHAELTRPADADLKYSIEKVISIFKTRLFQALCDIQDFYDKVLLNEQVPFDEKARETRRLAERWENNPPFGAVGLRSGGAFDYATKSAGSILDRPLGGGTTTKDILDRPLGGRTTIDDIRTTGSLLDRSSIFDRPGGGSILDRPLTNGVDSAATPGNLSSYTFKESKRELTRDGWATNDYSTKTIDGPGGVKTESHSASGLIDDQGREWEVHDVVIEKNQTGLGFSISGGRDRGDTDHNIHVTDISKGGAVYRDGRVKVGDVILRVNNVECVNVDHQVAVDALKSSGPIVRLVVKRPRPTRSVSQSDLASLRPLGGLTNTFSKSYGSGLAPEPIGISSPVTIPIHRVSEAIQRLEIDPRVRKMDLPKQDNSLGFSIAGGVGNQHVPGDNGIFVTRIIPNGAAFYDGRLAPNDKIHAVNDIAFDNVTHQFAVSTLKATGQQVTIYYEKNPYPDLVPPPVDDSGRSFTGLTVGDRSGSVPNFNNQSYGSQNPLVGAGVGAYVPSEPGLDPRVVTLKKGDGGLGFNIVGGEDGEPVYVSHVLPGGVADLSGNVRKGDILLQVNDMDLRNAVHNQAALALKNCPPNSYVNLTLQYRPQEFARFESKVEQLRTDMLNRQSGNASVAGAVAQTPTGTLPRQKDIYVRALFDNDPSRDTGVPHRALAFNYGDILHILNPNDDDWWTARRVTDAGEEAEGVIPSKRRVEKRERQRRKQVNFNAGSQSLGRNASLGGGLENRRGSRSQLSFSRKFPFVKSTEKINEYLDNNDPTQADEPLFSYEPVELKNINYTRPVVVLGAFKNSINDEIVRRYPDRFSSCVPHTSRPPRENDVHGHDYYFVSRAQMESDIQNNLFIEAGQFQGNLYGTSIKAVQDVISTGKHCVLDVSGNAIRRLINMAGIYPIVAFVKPADARQLAEFDPDKTIDQINQIEQNFGDVFTSVVQGKSFEDVVYHVMGVINSNQRGRIWVPSRQVLF